MSDTITITPTLISAPFVDSYMGPSGINDFGTIVVNSANLSYLEYDGTYQRLAAPELGTGTFHAAGINNEGVIAGDYISTGGEVGVIDDQGSFTTFSISRATSGFVPADATAFTAINDSGEVIGNFGSPDTDGDIDGVQGSFIEQNGSITLVHIPAGFSGAILSGIDNAGEIVGYYGGLEGYYKGFTDINGTFTTVEVPGSQSTVVWNINNNGEIVGGYVKSDTYYGFIDDNGSFTTVDFQGSTLGGELSAINDSGQVAGFEFPDQDYQFSAFTAHVPDGVALVTTISNGITLATIGGYPSPFTITSGHSIITHQEYGVYSSLLTPFLENDGFISAEQSGVYFRADGTVDNALITSTIEADFTAIQFALPGTVINFGTLSSGDAGIVLHSGGEVTNNGTGSAILGGQVGIGTDLYPNIPVKIYNQGTISGGAGDGLKIGGGATITDAGTISGSQDAIFFDGTTADRLILDPGAVLIGNVAFSSSASSTLELAAGAGTLAGIGNTISNLQTLAFDPGASWTLSGTSAGFADLQTITGFTNTDTLDLTDFIGSISGFNDLTGLTLANGTTSETLALTSLESFGTLTATPDGAGGTFIEEVTCFARGTRILTDHGEVPVEALKIGDCVRTLHAGFQPIKWIGTRTYAAPFCNHPKILPIRIRAHAIAENIPARDLYVSPGHAIALEGALIHASRLVNGRTITQLPHAEIVQYFHLELETHEVIFAENTPAETFLGEHFRNQFQNAREFAALYPGEAAPQVHCLPPLGRGFQLAAILRRINARAGIITPTSPGPLAGYIDVITPTRIIGWAADRAAPDEPVILDILAGAKTIGRTIANIGRPDVAAAGFGQGFHGFEFELPPNTQGQVTARRSADGGVLAHAMLSRHAS